MSTEDQRQPYYLEQFEHVAPQFRDAVGARVKQRLGETDLPVGSAVLAELLLGTYIVQTPDGLQPGQPITLPDVSKLKGLDVKRRDIPVIASRLGSIVRAATYSYETTANDKPFVPVRETLAAEDEIDCFSLYLDQIGATPLLSAEEEVALGTAIVRGKTLEETLVSATTGIPHRPELEADIQKARLAREQFILANTRLVVSAAKHYQNRGVDLPDLVQAGNIGLMRAVDKWDPTQGNKFSTYGMHWIKRELSQVIDDTSRTIRVPAYVARQT
jgi:DNA-directed RNA polymerase sigma subunit (sigma70/sigma32)